MQHFRCMGSTANPDPSRCRWVFGTQSVSWLCPTPTPLSARVGGLCVGTMWFGAQGRSHVLRGVLLSVLRITREGTNRSHVFNSSHHYGRKLCPATVSVLTSPGHEKGSMVSVVVRVKSIKTPALNKGKHPHPHQGRTTLHSWDADWGPTVSLEICLVQE